MKDKLIIWIIGIMIASLVLYNYSPELFAVNSIGNTKNQYSGMVYYPSSVSPGACFISNGEKTAVYSERYANKYKVYYIDGCECKLIYGNGNSNYRIILTSYDYATEGKYVAANYYFTLSEAKSALNNIKSLLTTKEPFRKYSYDYYYEPIKGKCKSKENSVSPKVRFAMEELYVAGWGYYGKLGSCTSPYILLDGKRVNVQNFLHEYGHNLGLDDLNQDPPWITDTGICKADQRNIMCLGNGYRSIFLPWQIDFIKNKLNDFKGCYS